MPVHPEHLSVPFHCSNSSSHSLFQGCPTAVVRGGEAVKLVGSVAATKKEEKVVF